MNFIYLVINGTHGGVHFIRNSDEVIRLIRFSPGLTLNIKNLGTIRVTGVERYMDNAKDGNYVYVKANRVWQI